MPADSAWITEALVQFTRSPVWSTPVNNFIDENCGAFDKSEEMRLEYTTIHRSFCALVDDLLTNFVQELGIPLETAIKAVKSSLGNAESENYKPLERLLNYIFTVEDFQSFHRMMVKRNIELEIIATDALLSRGIRVYGEDPAQVKAMLESGQLGEGTLALARAANGDVDEDAALSAAIAASLKDHGTPEQRHALEAAMLDEALALSVQAEKERARLATEEVERQAQQLAQTDAAAAEKLREEGLDAIEERKGFTIESLHSHVLEAQQRNDEAYDTVRKGIEISVPPSADPKETPTRAPVLEPLAASAAAKGPDLTTRTRLTAAATAPAPLPPIGGGGALPPIQALRPLGPISTASAPKAPSAAAVPSPSAAAAATQQQQPTKEQLEARAQHMKEQRARLVAMNKAKRQQELTNFASQTGTTAPPVESADPTAAQKQMTIEIARRLREDMLLESRRGSSA